MGKIFKVLTVTVVALVVVFAVSALVSSKSTLALSCAPSTIKEQIDNADVIFAGKVINIDTATAGKSDNATFQVSEYWKGKVGEKITIGGIRAWTGEVNPPPFFKLDENYLVFAIYVSDLLSLKGASGGLVALINCNRTDLLTNSIETKAVLGQGKAPGNMNGGYVFNKDLTVGFSGDDVYALQTFLEQNGFLVIPVGINKGYFGLLTKNALANYQLSKGIFPSAGYFGPLTRGGVNNDFGNDSNHSKTPVINGIEAPSHLNVNQQGTWVVKATEPGGKQLNYNVKWGDELVDEVPAIYPAAASNPSMVSQTSTFTHTYTAAGTYNIKFTVSNMAGKVSQIGTTVIIGSAPATNIIIDVASPNGGEEWDLNSHHLIKWRQSYVDQKTSRNPSEKVDIYLSPVNTRAVCIKAPCGPFFLDYLYVLDKNIANDFRYNWIVGTDVDNKPIPAGRYGLKICIAGTNNCDYSDGEFRLNDPEIMAQPAM